MRCFQSFFKHTWRPQQVHQMDPPSRFESTKKVDVHYTVETEMSGGRVTRGASSSVATSTLTTSPRVDELPCRNTGCKVLRNRDEPRPENPWHTLKTVFLVSMIAAFILWIVIYTLLDQYRIL